MPTQPHERAKRLDEGTERFLAGMALPSVKDCVAQIRTYLQKQNADSPTQNNVHKILKRIASHHVTSISVGPPFETGSPGLILLLGIRGTIVIWDYTARVKWPLFLGRIPLPSEPA